MQPEELNIPRTYASPNTAQREKEVNYYFLFSCLTALGISVATSATLMVLSTPASTLLAGTLIVSTLSSGIPLNPFVALTSVFCCLCLLPIIIKGIFRSQNSPLSSAGIFGNPYNDSDPASSLTDSEETNPAHGHF